MSFMAVKGSKDLFGNEILLIEKIENIVKKLAKNFYLEEIRTPIFEYTDVFKRAIGVETDIVSKEMFELQDRGGRNLCLRPEGTAGVVRAFCEHKLFQSKNTRYFYQGPMFRAERPQKGRQRQFHQIGIEIFGEKEAQADFDAIAFPIELLQELNIFDFQLKINSVGCPQCRTPYFSHLKQYLEPHKQKLCEQCQNRFEKNILRVLDCKNENCRNLTQNAPVLLDYLCEECNRHFSCLQTLLKSGNIDFQIDPKIVRGLDYYTKTAFEIQLNYLGSQNAICGGGRYDGLVGFFDPKNPTPAVGSAIGLERLLLALEEKKVAAQEKLLDYYIIVDPEIDYSQAIPLLQKIRTMGFSVLLDEGKKNISKQFKEANKKGALNTIVFGKEELENNTLTIKNMQTGEQKKVLFQDFFKEAKNG